MKDEYVGKHIKERETKKKIKNNPRIFDETTVEIISGTLATLLLTGVVATTIIKKTDLIPTEDKISYATMDEKITKEEMIELLNKYNETTTSYNDQLMIDLLKWYIEASNSTDINNQSTKELIYSTFDNTFTNLGYNKIPKINISNETYNYVVNNNEIMQYINQYAAEYNIPICVLIGLSCLDDTINQTDPLNYGKWDKIDSTQTVYNFSTGNKDDLNKQVDKCHNNIENSVKYAAMVFRQCLKESGGILYSGTNELDALDYYIDRNYKTNINKSTKIQKDEHNEKKNRILNGILRYTNSFNASIQYKYDHSNNYEELTDIKYSNIIYDDYKDELDTIYHNIIEYIIENSNTKSLG